MPGYANPQNLNRYSYVTNNPLRYIDPSGHMACEDYEGSCLSENQVTKVIKAKFENRRKVHKLVKRIRDQFENVTIANINVWSLGDLQEVYSGLTQINGVNGFNGITGAFSAAFGEVTFVPIPADNSNAVGNADWRTGVINLEPYATSSTVIHEMGHIFDGSRRRIDGEWPRRSTLFANVFNAGDGATRYARDRNSSAEDFADSFLAVILYGPQTDRIDRPRISIITALIQSYTNSGR